MNELLNSLLTSLIPIFFHLLCLGGFYSDTEAYVNVSCLKCPDGTFVPYNNAPGKAAWDCIACPQGKWMIREKNKEGGGGRGWKWPSQKGLYYVAPPPGTVPYPFTYHFQKKRQPVLHTYRRDTRSLFLFIYLFIIIYLLFFYLVCVIIYLFLLTRISPFNTEMSRLLGDSFRDIL